MTVKIRHTRSTSGRTHRLTLTHPDTGNYKKVPGRVEIVELRYATSPRFNDQVQGDLIRKYWAEGGQVSPIGHIPFGGEVDPELDKEESERNTPSPARVADIAMEHFHLHMEAHEVRALIESAIEADRKIR